MSNAISNKAFFRLALSLFLTALATYGCTKTTNDGDADPEETEEGTPIDDETDETVPPKDKAKPKDAGKTKQDASTDGSNKGGTGKDPSMPTIPAGIESYVAGTLTVTSSTSTKTVVLDPEAQVEGAEFGFFNCSTLNWKNAYGASLGWGLTSTPSVGTYPAASTGAGPGVMVGLPNGHMSTTDATIKITKADAANNVFEGTIVDLEAPFPDDNLTITAPKLWFRCKG